MHAGSWHKLSTLFKRRLIRGAAFSLGIERSARFLARRIDWAEHRPGKPTVLCLNRPQFAKDVAELRQHTDTNWPTINVNFMSEAQSAWVPTSFTVQTAFQKTQVPENATLWARLERFGEVILEEAEKTAPIDALLTAHIDYWQAEGIRMAGAKRGIPLIVLCREHCYLPAHEEVLTSHYKSFNFEGAAVGVMGLQTRNVFVNSGSCRADQVHIVGAPRFDRWRAAVAERDNGTAVLLSFMGEGYRAPQLFAEVLAAFEQEAKASTGDATFVIKAKDAADAANIKGRLKMSSDNLSIVVDTPMDELLIGARIIIGFNTLALAEAMMTRAPIVIPNWAEATELNPDRLVFDPRKPDHARAVTWPASLDECRDVLQRASQSLAPVPGDVTEARLAVINKLLLVPRDETSSALVDEMVRSAIASAKQANAA